MRSTDSSARSGLVARTTRSSGAPARSRSPGATSERVMASESPVPTSASATRRRSRWRTVSAPTCPWVSGSVRPMRSKPMRRATSSTRSISRSRSGRKVGTIATTVSASSVAPSDGPGVSSSIPSGASAAQTSSSSRLVPSTALTRLGAQADALPLDRCRIHVDRRRARPARPPPGRAAPSRGPRCGRRRRVDPPLEPRARLASAAPAASSVRAMPIRSKYADSSRIPLVASEHLRRRRRP